MQINLLSILAIVLATASVTIRAAPVGKSAIYISADPTSGEQKSSGTATVDGTNQQPEPAMSQGLQCWNAYRSGSNFSITCNGSRWFEYTDCSDGYRYTIGPFAGALRVTITCPGRSLSLRGGAYGN